MARLASMLVSGDTPASMRVLNNTLGILDEHVCFQIASVISDKSRLQLEFSDSNVISLAGANELCGFLWGAHYDAFYRSGSVVLLFVSPREAFRSTIVKERVAPERQ